MLTQGTLTVTETPYGELFDFSFPGKNIPHFYLHDRKNNRWYELSEQTIAGYNLVMSNPRIFEVVADDDGKISSVNAVAQDITESIDSILKHHYFWSDIEFHFDCVDTTHPPIVVDDRMAQEYNLWK